MKLPAIRINPLGMLVLCGLVIFLVFIYASGHYDKNSKEVSISLKHLLAVGISVAEAGGAKVREIRTSSDIKESSKGKTKEGANDPLTAGDLESHKIMLHSLKSTFPKLQVVSEEHEVNDISDKILKLPTPPWELIRKITDDIEIPASDILVWIDPLDATQEYTENLLEYVTTMVCVAVRGKPVIGIVHRPFQNTTVWAWVNHGVSDSNFASESKLDPGDAPTIIVSRSHAGKVSEVAKAVFGPNVKVVSAGGAGYKCLQVAEGKADAYIHVTLIKKWDICAGNAILNALGGQMTTMTGELIDYSDPKAVQNDKGLLATLYNHKKYLEKVSSLRN